MSRKIGGINCGTILAADVVHLIKYGKLANKDDYTTADVPEFRKYMQLAVIHAKQILQNNDDVTLLPQIYSLIEEERRLHTFDNDILGGGSKQYENRF